MRLTYDIAHASSELLESDVQSERFKIFESPEARAISGRYRNSIKTMTLGKKIRHLRKRKGFSQELLAEVSGISVRTIQRIEKGDSVPHPYTLKKMADVLETPVEYLSKEEESQSYLAQTDETFTKLGLINFSAMAVLLLPYGNLLLPGIVWYRNKNLPLVNALGKKIISFQILWTLGTSFVLICTPFLQHSLIQNAGIIKFPLILLVYFVLIAFNYAVIIQSAIRLKKNDSEVYSFVPSLF